MRLVCHEATFFLEFRRHARRALVLLYFALLATGVNAGRLFLRFGWRLGRPSSQTTITAGGTLTR